MDENILFHDAIIYDLVIRCVMKISEERIISIEKIEKHINSLDYIKDKRNLIKDITKIIRKQY